MINYEPFWTTLQKRAISTYKLINNYHISSSTLNRLRHNKPLSTTTLDDLCNILNCKIEEVVRYERIKK